MTRFGLALVWMLHWLPLPVLAAFGRGAGLLLYALARERRRVVLTNLRLCFPQLGDGARGALARRHFAAFGRSLFEHGILWWGSRARVLRHDGPRRVAVRFQEVAFEREERASGLPFPLPAEN